MKSASEAMPTLEQVEEEVLTAEAEMAAAKARKDYRRAAELSVKLPAMHDRHSAVASAIRKAMTRKQLAEEIQRLEGEVRGRVHVISGVAGLVVRGRGVERACFAGVSFDLRQYLVLYNI